MLLRGETQIQHICWKRCIKRAKQELVTRMIYDPRGVFVPKNLEERAVKQRGLGYYGIRWGLKLTL